MGSSLGILSASTRDTIEQTSQQDRSEKVMTTVTAVALIAVVGYIGAEVAEEWFVGTATLASEIQTMT